MNPFAYVSAGLAAIVVILLFVLYFDHKEIDRLNTEVGSYAIANKSFVSETETQNAYLQKYKTDQQKQDDAVTKAEADATKKNSVIDNQIDALQHNKQSSDDCKSANELFNQFLGAKK